MKHQHQSLIPIKKELLKHEDENTRFYYRPSPTANLNQGSHPNDNDSESKNQPYKNSEKQIFNNQNGPDYINSINFPEFKKYNKNDLQFKEFVPKDKLEYLFLAELNEPNYRMITASFKKLFGIKFAADIQRFRYYPKTKNIYTFIGFSNKKQLDMAFNHYSIRSSSINQSLYLYPYIVDEKKSSLNVSQNTTVETPTLNNNPIQNNAEKVEIFQPYDDLYYIYFKEKNYSIFNIHEKSSSLFGISKIQDIQRGYRINEKDFNCFTFLGFHNSIDANFAMSALCGEKQIDTSSIQKFDNDETVTTSSDEDSDINDLESDDEDENDINLLHYSQNILPEENIHFNS